jgi:hypothetical protein
MITWYFVDTAQEFTQTCTVSGWLLEHCESPADRRIYYELYCALAGATPTDRPVLVVTHPITMCIAPDANPRRPDEVYTLTAQICDAIAPDAVHQVREVSRKAFRDLGGEEPFIVEPAPLRGPDDDPIAALVQLDPPPRPGHRRVRSTDGRRGVATQFFDELREARRWVIFTPSPA